MLGESVEELKISGISAQFKVSSHAEQWRVEECMGETEIVKRFLSDISSSTEVWDIGAAVGTYTVLAAKRANHVTAFEPEPANYRRLCENVDLNDLNNVEPHNVALSDSNKELEMYVAGDSVGGGAHEISSSGNLSVSARRGGEIESPSPDVIKIDVEGHEMAVLSGLGDKLSDCDVIYVEAHPQNGVSVGSLCERLQQHGHETVRIRDNDRSETYVRGVNNSP